MPNIHHMPIEIGFKHCDPAGIVFYPRYAEMLHDTVEHWFNHGLKIGFNYLHTTRNMGIPMVNLQVDFRIPSRLGDILDSRLVVKKLGRSSMQMLVRICGPDNDVRVEGRLTVVFASLGKISSVEIPEDFKALILPYVDDSAEA
ncbi:4-hydroxybenzoyl-CoA thioesterase [Pusillimonas sp. T2]|uniref:acyl-CoA thioesterase n=1 Tax=Pusillimonas sp. T2 TaxID=1548123 RepID=UPI000B9CCD47|nr:acyl-CoA thioesterase [Pusillimonas sp. T2]OXR50136.1 4-hydroxybenzoyl-CoA thioesterase [Pusillimonas sp. T2]